MEVVRVFSQHGAACRNKTCKGAAGLLLPVQMTRALGWIASWPPAYSEMLDLGRRFRSLLEQLSSRPGGPIPLACQDWASTKAAYRFLDNDRVSEAQFFIGGSPRRIA